MTVLEKVKSYASRFPDRLVYCLEHAGETAPETLTWGQLDRYSDNLSSRLYRSQHTPPVIVYGHKSPYMVVCFLACVKAGRAYCPIDTSVPSSRVEAIVREVAPDIILSTEEFPCAADCDILSLDTIISISQQDTGAARKERWVSAEDIFYIIFTSGSTGVPKGVQITRDCLDCFLRWAVTLLPGQQDDRPLTFINQAPFSFDLSVMDLYLTLYTGGTLWAVEKSLQGDMRHLLASLGRSGANVWVSTPSFADMCLSDPSFTGTLLPRLDVFLFCGEVLTNRTADLLLKRFPKAAVVNTYGPTESTVAVTNITVTDSISQKWNPLPVGAEKPGTWIRIVDSDGNALPDGERGEIVIIGDSVSVGYWNNREATGRAFGTCEINGQSYRLYHTGDKGYKTDGQLFYCGRIDLQIKLHGYRIELEDIENNLSKLTDVRQAAVVPVVRDGKVRSLTAYVVPAEGPVKEQDFAFAQSLRGQLRAYVPEYMIPKKFVFLPSLPMTNNGKVNRKALGGG